MPGAIVEFGVGRRCGGEDGLGPCACPGGWRNCSGLQGDIGRQPNRTGTSTRPPHPHHTAPCPYAHQAVVCCETLIWFLTFAPHRTLSLRTWHVWVVKWVPMGTGMACLCPGRQILPT